MAAYEYADLLAALKAEIAYDSLSVSAPSPYDLENIEDIIAGRGDWFSAQLFRLIAKADPMNRERLRSAYPIHVHAFEEWQRGDRERPRSY